MAHREQSIPRLGDFRSDVPEAIEALFRKMVAKQARQRPATMNDVIAAVKACRPPAARRAVGTILVAVLCGAGLAAVVLAGYSWPWPSGSRQPGKETVAAGGQRTATAPAAAHDPLEDNRDAYALYKKGLRMMEQRQERLVQAAIGYFESAVQAAPASALATRHWPTHTIFAAITAGWRRTRPSPRPRRRHRPP